MPALRKQLVMAAAVTRSQASTRTEIAFRMLILGIPFFASMLAIHTSLQRWYDSELSMTVSLLDPLAAFWRLCLEVRK